MGHEHTRHWKRRQARVASELAIALFERCGYNSLVCGSNGGAHTIHLCCVSDQFADTPSEYRTGEIRDCNSGLMLSLGENLVKSEIEVKIILSRASHKTTTTPKSRGDRKIGDLFESVTVPACRVFRPAHRGRIRPQNRRQLSSLALRVEILRCCRSFHILTASV